MFALLYDTCLRLENCTVRDSMLAQEVVQEAFLAAWQHAPARLTLLTACWPTEPVSSPASTLEACLHLADHVGEGVLELAGRLLTRQFRLQPQQTGIAGQDS